MLNLINSLPLGSVFLGVFFVGVIIITVIVAWNMDNYGKDVPISHCIIIVCLFFLGLGSCGYELDRFDKGIKPAEETIDIYSVGLNKAGIDLKSFTLGQNGAKYLFFVGDSLSGFNLESIPARITTIKYSNEQPRVVLKYSLKPRWFKPDTCFSKGSINEAELYLPSGSLIQDYKIEL